MRGLRITYIAELLVHFEDFICDLGAGDHWASSHLLEDGSRQENQLLVLALVVVAVLVLLLEDLLLLGVLAPKLREQGENGLDTCNGRQKRALAGALGRPGSGSDRAKRRVWLFNLNDRTNLKIYRRKNIFPATL